MTKKSNDLTDLLERLDKALATETAGGQDGLFTLKELMRQEGCGRSAAETIADRMVERGLAEGGHKKWVKDRHGRSFQSWAYKRVR